MLVEQDEVLGIFGSLGTATNIAMQRYLNHRGACAVLHLERRRPDARSTLVPLDDRWRPRIRQRDQGVRRIFLLETQPSAKVGVLMQNDDFGRDHLTGSQTGAWWEGGRAWS